MAALGGDFGTLSTNPAGLAIYRGSEFTITPTFSLRGTEAELRGSNNIFDDSRNQFFLGNLGIVIHTQPLSKSIRALNFGLGFNHTARYNRDLEWRGVTGGSITDRWLEISELRDPSQLDDFEAGPAFDAGAIFDFDGDLVYDSDFSGYGAAFVDKGQVIDQSGTMSDFLMSVGVNLKDKLMIGFSLGIPFVNFEEEKTYNEYDDENLFDFFEGLGFKESLVTSGIGVNAKLGMNYLVSDAIRVGAYVHTPTRFSFTDNFSTEVNYVFDEGQGPVGITIGSPEGTFDYRFSSPWVFGGGVGFIIKRSGFISADVEYIDYSSNKFDLNFNNTTPDIDDFQESLNNRVATELRSAINFRVGGELALKKLRVRAGVNYRPEPLESTANSSISYRAGLGYRSDKFFADFAYSYSDGEQQYEPYFTNSAPRQLIDTKIQEHLAMLTFGFRF